MAKINDLNAQHWLEEHGDYLFCYALLKVKDNPLAEDLVQEILLAAISAQNTFSNHTGILKHKGTSKNSSYKMRQVRKK